MPTFIKQVTELSSVERKSWMRLIRTDHIGPMTFYQLLKKYGSACEALRALQSEQRHHRFSPPPIEQVEAELAYADEIKARYVAFCQHEYPDALRHIPDPPPILCTHGDLTLFSRKSIGIVGARNASAAGRKLAATLAHDLGQEGIVIVSGLARGVDGAAHEASLKFATIAVVAGGIDVIYPPEHDQLTAQIAKQGLLISEMPLGYKPRGKDFPRRNRIISGLSKGVVIVEAAKKSGTLITARFASEQGREVFAIPGSPLDPRSQGTNQLIRDGAALVESAQDIIDALNETPRNLFTVNIDEDERSSFEEEPANTKTSITAEVKELLSLTPTYKDDLIRNSKLPSSKVNEALLELVLHGEAEEHSGGCYTRA